MRQIEIIQIRDHNYLKKFIYLPSILHIGHKNWVPPIYSDEWSYYNQKKNRAFAYCDTIMALAVLNGKPAGRIMGIINNRYNNERKELTARYSMLECINDNEISSFLFRFVEDWAKKRGMTKIIGPFGMNYHDPTGMMVDGFDQKPALTTYYNYEYFDNLHISAGYNTEIDLVDYKIPIEEFFPEFYTRIYQKASQNSKIKIINLNSRREIKKYIFPVLNLMNQCYSDIYGFSQLDNEEMIDVANHYIPLLDPRLIKIAEYNGEIAGFIIGMPNLNEGIISAGGKLYPFGFLKILKAARKSNQLDLLIGAIKKGCQGIGIDVLLGIEMINTAKKIGFTVIDSHLELESNKKVRSEMERLGGKICKRYRIYQKSLT
jgi:hypothetical protein